MNEAAREFLRSRSTSADVERRVLARPPLAQNLVAPEAPYADAAGFSAIAPAVDPYKQGQPGKPKQPAADLPFEHTKALSAMQVRVHTYLGRY